MLSVSRLSEKRPTYIYLSYGYVDTDTVNGYPTGGRLSEIKQAQLDASAKPYRLWNLETKEGRKAWKFYYVPLLAGYDFDGFTAFDFIGTTEDIEQAELDRLRTYYKRLQADYDKNPTDYYNGDMDADTDDYTRYRYRVEYTTDYLNILEEDARKQGYGITPPRYEWFI